MGGCTVLHWWMASGCGGWFGTHTGVQSQILERIPWGGEERKSGGNYSCGALWRPFYVVRWNPMGYGDELRCFYGANQLVFDRYGETQRCASQWFAWKCVCFLWFDDWLWGKIYDAKCFGSDEWAVESRPFPLFNPYESCSWKNRVCRSSGGELRRKSGGYAPGGTDADDMGRCSDDLLRWWGWCVRLDRPG